MTDVLLEEFAPPEPFDPPAWVAEELARPTGKGLTVAVVDSGWDRACNDPRVLPGVGLVDPDDDLALKENDDDHDRVGHGTACIHQILRIAPDARVIPIRVFGRSLETSPHTLQAAIRVAIEQKVDVVNLSLGTRLEGTLKMLYAACEYARRQGMIIVAAGDNSRDWSYPAIFENVIGVSAARFQSPYEYRYLVEEAHECQAWGIEQPVVWLNGEEQVKHGTSFAAPNITGIVCLLLERHPGATLEEIRELLAKYAMERVLPGSEEPNPLADMLTLGQRQAGLMRGPGTRKLATARPADSKSAAKKRATASKPATARKAAAGETSAPAKKRAAAKPAATKTAPSSAPGTKRSARSSAKAGDAEAKPVARKSAPAEKGADAKTAAPKPRASAKAAEPKATEGKSKRTSTSSASSARKRKPKPASN